MRKNRFERQRASPTLQAKEKLIKGIRNPPEDLFGKRLGRQEIQNRASMEKYCFVVTYRREGSKHYEMKAETEVECMGWIRAIDIASDEAHFWLNGFVNKQNCRIWSEANPQVYVEIPLHPEKLTAWCALWAGGILLQKL
ncbi:uncharacterized protein TNCV_31031 [Trichonephila clavipes]|nr:uncharacterized protein TNCV_31031 [Trichonephila clavipes]